MGGENMPTTQAMPKADLLQKKVSPARKSRLAGPTLSSTARPSPPRPTGASFSVEKALIGLGFFAASVMVVLFGLDLACAWPFGRYTPIAEAVFCGCGATLGYLSWDAYRDLR
jgi:hypothetical protein